MRRATGNHTPAGALPWFPVRLAAPVYPLAHEMPEMRYLWQTPLKLDNQKLIAILGAEPHTALDEAVRVAMAGLKRT